MSGRDSESVRCVCVRVCVHVRACVCACVCAFALEIPNGMFMVADSNEEEFMRHNVTGVVSAVVGTHTHTHTHTVTDFGLARLP